MTPDQLNTLTELLIDANTFSNGENINPTNWVLDTLLPLLESRGITISFPDAEVYTVEINEIMPNNKIF